MNQKNIGRSGQHRLEMDPGGRLHVLSPRFRTTLMTAVLTAVVCSAPVLGPGAAGATQIVPRAVSADTYWQSAWNAVHDVERTMTIETRLRRGLSESELTRGAPALKEIALTFDDGPHPRYTPQILAILKRYNAKATFFVVGEMAERYPQLIRAEIAGGHSVGNHTYSHPNLTQVPEDYVAAEIKGCGEVIESITHRPAHLFRPPGGDYNPRVAEEAEALGYTTVLWTDDPGDYASPGAKVIQKRLLAHVHNGGIVLIHDGIQQTIDILPTVIEDLTRQGYRFVTVDQLMRDRLGVRSRVMAA